MNNDPLVTVVVPVYNIEMYIGDCLRSILAQSYGNLEIIIVDDGSTDRCAEICDGFAEIDNRIIVFHKENGGLVDARKYGIERAHGCYILNVDGDDSIYENMIEKLVCTIQSSQADVVQCGFENGENKIYQYPEYIMDLSDKDRIKIVEKWFLGNPLFDSQVITKLCKLEVMKDAYLGIPNTFSLGEDVVFFSRIVAKAKRIASIKDILYKYRIRNGSLSHPHKSSILGIINNDALLNELYFSFLRLYGDTLKDLLEEWIIVEKIKALNGYFCDNLNRRITLYSFDHINLFRGKKIAVYGAGRYGRDLMIQLSTYTDVYVSCWVDKNADRYLYDFRKVEYPNRLSRKDWDYVIIAIKDIKISEDIALELQKELLIDPSAIIWNYNRRINIRTLFWIDS